MIILFGGSQVDAPGREPARLPEEAVEPLYDRLRGLIHSLSPRLMIGALASGADILFARAGLAEGCELKIILPTSRDEFRRSSVEDRGPSWISAYDTILGHPDVTLIEDAVSPLTSGDVFIRHNATLVEAAVSEAGLLQERAWSIVVRPIPTAQHSVSDDLADRAELSGLLTIDLDPRPTSRRCFVAMPYGTKKNPRSGRKIDCDQPFDKIYRVLLEDADLTWTRADLQTDTGLIHSAMIEALVNSDLVLADLTTANFNVGYELGIRHACAPWATLLVHPRLHRGSHSPQPFDVNGLRIHSFSRGETVSDGDAEDAIRRLRPVVQAALAGPHRDSPVHEWFELDHVHRPYRARTQTPRWVDAESELRKQIDHALKTTELASLRAAAAELDQSPHARKQIKAALHLELASGMAAEGAYEDARVQLEKSRPDNDDIMHRAWLQRSIMVHRRLGESATSSDLATSYLNTARMLLAEAEDAGYLDSETYGIWGGLIKRQLEMTRSGSDPAIIAALFADMAAKYRKGFELDPSYYTGVNLVMALRLGDRERDPVFRQEFDEVLTVSRFLTRLAIKTQPDDYWALATDAELTLHQVLESGQAWEPVRPLYARAALNGRKDQISSTLFQLRFLESHGDPSDLIASVSAVLREPANV